MGFGGLCEFCVLYGSVVAFVIFFTALALCSCGCVSFLICFVVCACVPVVSLDVFLCLWRVCFSVCLCGGLWWPCLGRLMMCILYVVLSLVWLVGRVRPFVCL